MKHNKSMCFNNIYMDLKCSILLITAEQIQWKTTNKKCHLILCFGIILKTFVYNISEFQ